MSLFCLIYSPAFFTACGPQLAQHFGNIRTFHSGVLGCYFRAHHGTEVQESRSRPFRSVLRAEIWSPSPVDTYRKHSPDDAFFALSALSTGQCNAASPLCIYRTYSPICVPKKERTEEYPSGRRHAKVPFAPPSVHSTLWPSLSPRQSSTFKTR